MRIRWILFAWVFIPTIAGCGRDNLSLLESADSITLYSIDGNDYEPGKEPKSEEKFYDYPVLGKVDVTEPSKRQELIDALKVGITEHSKGIKCFWPRHGVRAVRGNQWVDFVICFHCLNVYEYSSSGDRRKEKGVNANRALKEVLNKYLTAAGVPLAPEK
jgi:hypothetical protein